MINMVSRNAANRSRMNKLIVSSYYSAVGRMPRKIKWKFGRSARIFYSTMTHKYTLLYRPPSSCTLPKGWILVERPQVPGFEKRMDLPESIYRFGAVEFERRLSEQEVADFQLHKL